KAGQISIRLFFRLCGGFGFSAQHNNPERMPPSKAAANAVNGEAVNVAKAAINPPNIVEITGWSAANREKTQSRRRLKTTAGKISAAIFQSCRKSPTAAHLSFCAWTINPCLSKQGFLLFSRRGGI
ncbi:TPA: hypothetical protein ACE6P7_002255, partial [Neisseria gonorrhoeae]